MPIKDRFEELKNKNFYSRISVEHILELHIGLDEKGRKSIELRYPFTPRKVTGTSSIEVAQYKKDTYNTIRFSLCDEEISGLFYKFCEDLVEQTKELKDESEGYQTIINRFFQWKKMFVSSKKNFLTEPEIMGLIGEILILRDYLSGKLGLSKALKSWSGQELTHKDFSFDNTWIESKAISRSAQNVKISSLEQLDSDFEGELAIHSLEKMSTEYNGITLNKLILDTQSMFLSNEEKESFMAKVALQGYEYNNYYDDFVYEISSFKRYSVNSDFPKLTHRDLPVAIRKAMYELSLVDIADFEIKN